MITVGAAAPASAAGMVVADILPPSSGPVTAPTSDGTNGAYDGNPVIYLSPTKSLPSAVSGAGTLTPFGAIICDAGSTWNTVSSPQKTGAVTTWSKHVKNDATPETFTWNTSNSITVQASTTVTGSLTVAASLKSIASASLGISTNFGIQSEVASSTSYSRSVTFSSAGSWIIWAGVYKGSGSVQMFKCSSNGQTISTIGTGSGATYNKARVTGLTNCANSVSDLVEINAKTRC